MEFSRPRPSILSLFDPLSLTPELDRAISPDSDKENDTSDFFKPSGTLKHIHVPPRTLKRRLVDVGDITVEHPNMNALLSDELEQEISYIVDDDENDTLTFRDMAKAATPKWSSCHATVSETLKVLPLPRTPLAEISLKDELTPLARKKPYKRQLVSTTSKGSEPACLIFPPSISSDNSSGCPVSYTEVPEVRVNDEPAPQSLSESSFPRTSNQSMPTETQVTGTLSSSLVTPAPCPAQPRTRHLSPMSPTDNANRCSVDLQTSFQIHFPSQDTTFDLLKDKISFFSSKNELDSFLNNLEGDSSIDDISIPGPGSKIKNDSKVSSTITLNQVVKSEKRLIDHPTPVSKDVGVPKPSVASHTCVDALTPIQSSISNRINTMPSSIDDTNANLNQATFVQSRAFHPPYTSPPLPLVADGSRPMSTPSSFVDNPRYPPPQIPALRIVKRSKTIAQQKPSIMTKDGPPQDAPAGSRVPPVSEAPASSSLTTISKKGRPSEISQVRRTDKVHLPPSLASNGPRRVLISEVPNLNFPPNPRASEQGKPSSTCGPRRVAMVVPSTVVERTSSSARPPVQPSSRLQQPVKYGTSVVKPVQRTAGSRLPAITRRIGVNSGASGGVLPTLPTFLECGMKFRLSRQHKANLEQFDSKTICPSLHDDPAFSADPHSNPYSVTSHNSWLSSPPLGHPVLKNKKKRPDIILAPHGITADSDSDFQLVQPPNSPNILGGSFPQHPNPLTMYNKLPTLSSASSSMNQGPTPSVMSQGDHRSSLLKKENKRMSFLSRRQSAQPQPIKSFFSSIGKKAHRRSDLPAPPDDMAPPQPVQHTEDFPTSASMAPRKVLGDRGRVQDLDQIDELDETNPWGIRIHHDGPYEVANVQANKGAGHVPLGLASSNEVYNTHVLQANYQTYIPPQVPIGVSLNLSPGQILPRHFHVPFIQPARMSSTLHGPYTPHFPTEPLLTPPNEPQYKATVLDVTDSSSQVRDDVLPTMQHGDKISSIIGMAMLELTDNAPVPPRSQADLLDFAPYDRVDQSEHRRVSSLLVPAQPEPSRGQLGQSFQNASSTGTSSNNLDMIRPTGHLRNDPNPPMYSKHINDEEAGRQILDETPWEEQKQLQSSSQSSQNSLTSQNPELLAGERPQHVNDSDNGPPSNDLRNVSFLPPDRNILPPPAVSRDERVDVTQGLKYTSPAPTLPHFFHPHRDGLPLPSANYGNEPDVQSIHYSTSTYSSGQFQNGRRPPPRHLPKRLVMPSPLNTGPPPNTAASLYDSRVPRSQISSYANVEQTYGNTRAEHVPMFGGRKLRKKTSIIVTPTPAPVIATVSFAPPIIGFHQSDEKAQSKTEDRPKRFLSKRKT